MLHEIEIKYRLADPAALRARLQAAGATRAVRTHESNTLWDTRAGSLRKQGCGLRLREHLALDDNKAPPATLTFKGARQPEPLLKIREELETGITNAEQLRLILDRLGLHEVVAYEKRREVWTLDGCQVCVDELPRLGWFVEVEGPAPPSVKSVCARLSLPDGDVIPETYVELALHNGCQGSDGVVRLTFED